MLERGTWVKPLDPGGATAPEAGRGTDQRSTLPRKGPPWTPIVFASITVVVGALFVPETKDRDIFADD